MELNKIDLEKFRSLVEAALVAAGIPGKAEADLSCKDGVLVSFTRSDGAVCGISGGGRLTNSRTEEQLAELFSMKMIDWYARSDAGDFDDPIEPDNSTVDSTGAKKTGA